MKACDEERSRLTVQVMVASVIREIQHRTILRCAYARRSEVSTTQTRDSPIDAPAGEARESVA